MPLEVLVIGRQLDEPPPGLPETKTGVSYTIAADMDSVRAHMFTNR